MTNSAKVIVIQLVVWYDFSVVDSDKSEFMEINDIVIRKGAKKV